MMRILKYPSPQGELSEAKGDEPRALHEPAVSKSKKPYPIRIGFLKERRRHTLPQYCSTICAGGLNYSVRDGKR